MGRRSSSGPGLRCLVLVLRLGVAVPYVVGLLSIRETRIVAQLTEFLLFFCLDRVRLLALAGVLLAGFVLALAFVVTFFFITK